MKGGNIVSSRTRKGSKSDSFNIGIRIESCEPFCIGSRRDLSTLVVF
jgi:hypothetical protein